MELVRLPVVLDVFSGERLLGRATPGVFDVHGATVHALGMARHTLRDALERLPADDQATLRRLQAELDLDNDTPVETAMRRAAAAPGPGSQSGHAPALGLPAGVQAMWSARRCRLCGVTTRLEARQARCNSCKTAWLGQSPAGDWARLNEHDPELVATIKSGQSKDRFLADLRTRLPETRDPGPLLRVLAALLADPRGEKVPSSALATRLARLVWRKTLGLDADPPTFADSDEWWAQS